MSEVGEDTDAAADDGWWPWALVTFIAVTAGRYAFSSDRRVFHVSPDEPSQLAIARWLAGDRRWNMFDHATWQPGLGTLLTPVYWLTDDPTTAVRSALTFNAVVGGVGGLLLFVIVRRLSWLGPIGSAVVSVMVALAPASLSASAFVWAEPLVTAAFLAVVLALLQYVESGQPGWAVAANVLAVAGYTCHSRLLPLIGTTLVITVALEAWRRRWWGCLAMTGFTALAVALSASWTSWILDNVWDDPSDQNTVSSVWERATQPLEVGEAAIGQIWYQLVATFGVAGIGMYVVVRSLRRQRADTPVDRDRVAISAAWILVVSTAPMIGLSAVFMSDRGRPDQYIYGRYNDAVMWPVLALGLAWMAHRALVGYRGRDWLITGAITATMAGTGIVVEILHGDEIRERYGVRSMIAGILHYVDDTDTLDVRVVTVVSAAGFLVATLLLALVSMSRVPEPARAATLVIGSAALVGVFAWGVTRLEDTADLRLNGWERTAVIVEIDDLLPPGAPVGVKPVSNSRDPVIEWVPQRQRFQMYQLYLPQRSFVRDRGVDDPNGPYVLAPLQDPLLMEAGAEMIWRDPYARLGLWVEPEE